MLIAFPSPQKQCMAAFEEKIVFNYLANEATYPGIIALNVVTSC